MSSLSSSSLSWSSSGMSLRTSGGRNSSTATEARFDFIAVHTGLNGTFQILFLFHCPNSNIRKPRTPYRRITRISTRPHMDKTLPNILSDRKLADFARHSEHSRPPPLNTQRHSSISQGKGRGFVEIIFFPKRDCHRKIELLRRNDQTRFMFMIIIS